MSDLARHKTSIQPARRLSIVALISAALLTFSALAAQNKKAPERKPEETQQKPQNETGEVIQLPSDLVVVTVTVTDAIGKYAHGLKAKDFAVSEDNAPQTINSFSAEEAPFAATILVDMSGSMEHKFSLVRASAANFVEKIRDDDQVAV